MYIWGSTVWEDPDCRPPDGNRHVVQHSGPVGGSGVSSCCYHREQEHRRCVPSASPQLFRQLGKADFEYFYKLTANEAKSLIMVRMSHVEEQLKTEQRKKDSDQNWFDPIAQAGVISACQWGLQCGRPPRGDWMGLGYIFRTGCSFSEFLKSKWKWLLATRFCTFLSRL